MVEVSWTKFDLLMVDSLFGSIASLLSQTIPPHALGTHTNSFANECIAAFWSEAP